MKNRVLFIGMGLILLVGLSGCFSFNDYVIEYCEGEYVVDTDTILDVTTFNGEIMINSWDGNSIVLNATKRSQYGQNDLDLIKINVINSTNKIEFVVEYLGVKPSKPIVDMNISVPYDVIIDDIHTSNGAIMISGVKGNVSAMSSNGRIHIENVDGYISATTSNGNIEVIQTTGINDLITSNGKIYVEIYGLEENTLLRSSNGDIEVYIDTTLDAEIEITTSNGAISTTGVTMNVTQYHDNYFNGSLGVGGNLLNIHTSNGDITLYEL